MEKLFKHISETSKGAIPYNDAVQLMLWIYCTLEVLPRQFRDLRLSRAELAALFSKLSAVGKVEIEPVATACDATAAADDPTQQEHWDRLISKLLLKEIPLEEAFRAKLTIYL